MNTPQTKELKVYEWSYCGPSTAACYSLALYTLRVILILSNRKCVQKEHARLVSRSRRKYLAQTCLFVSPADGTLSQGRL
jgi:hypothetical protein